MPMRTLLASSAFGPQETKVIGEAFDSAWLMLRKYGVAYADGAEVVLRERLARRLLETAQTGVVDRIKLADDGVNHILKSAERQKKLAR